MIKRITALLFSLAMLLTLPPALFSCAESSPTVMEVGGVKVSYNMLRYFVKNYMGDATASDYEDDEAMQEQLTEQVYGALRQLIACEKVADEHDIELTDEVQDSIDAQIESIKSGYESEEAYNEAIKAQFGDEATMRRILELSVLQNNLSKYLTDEYNGIIKSDDPTVRADIEAGNFFSAEYLYIYCNDDDRAEKSAFAQELHTRIANGESMSAIDTEYQTTFGLSMDYSHLPAFTYTEKLQYFEEAVCALKIGELSEVIERPDGMLIVKRLELDMDYINDNFMTVVDSYIAREYTEYMQDFADGLEIEWKSDYKDLKLWEIE